MAKIFVSYASEDAPVAQDIAMALAAAGHDAFFDRHRFRGADDFDGKIRHAIQACDLFVFLLSPSSVAQGRYTHTELKFAREHWPIPRGRILSVEVSPVDMAQVPGYLKALHILRPEGHAPAEVRAAVDDLAAALWSQPADTEPPGLVTKLLRELRALVRLPVALTIAAAAGALALLLGSGAAACRDPSHGLERYAKQVLVERISGPLPINTLPAQWCEAAQMRLRREEPGARVRVVENGTQIDNLHCGLLPCSQAQFRCVLEVSSEPQYILRTSLACLRKS